MLFFYFYLSHFVSIPKFCRLIKKTADAKNKIWLKKNLEMLTNDVFRFFQTYFSIQKFSRLLSDVFFPANFKSQIKFPKILKSVSKITGGGQHLE